MRIYISLTPSTKLVVQRLHLGSFRVAGGQKVIFTKNATPVNYIVYTYICMTQAHSSILDPLKKLWGKDKSGVTWGHMGQIIIFIKIAPNYLYHTVQACDSCICINIRLPTHVIGSDVICQSSIMESFKGVLHLLPQEAQKLACFQLLSQNYDQHLFEN